jgi:CheY-like chemotaxis protein
MASDARNALAEVLKLEPDLVVLDISMPGMTGIEVARELKCRGNKTRIVFPTVHETRTSSRLAYPSEPKAQTDIEDPIAGVSSADLVSHATLLLLTVTSRERLRQYREILEVVASNSEHQSIASFSAEQGRGRGESS